MYLKKYPKNKICDHCGKTFIATNSQHKYCGGGRENKGTCSYFQRIEYAKNREYSLYNKYKRYKKGAKDRKHKFELSFKEFSGMWKKSCYYCGDEIKTIGIDRIDSKIGYNIENCIPCCTICNYMKGTHSMDFFINHINKIFILKNK